MESLESISQTIYEVIMTYGPKLVGAIITLIIGWWIIKMLQRAIRKPLKKEKWNHLSKVF